MKKLLVAILAVMFMAGTAMAGACTLQWSLDDPSNGVMIYIGTESGNYTNSFDAGVGAVEATIPNLVPGVEYFFSAKAYNPQGLYSVYSNEVSGIVKGEVVLPELPPIALPNGVTITIKVE